MFEKFNNISNFVRIIRVQKPMSQEQTKKKFLVKLKGPHPHYYYDPGKIIKRNVT